jgi:4'-phosphopantetheinyl transferase EntD
MRVSPLPPSTEPATCLADTPSLTRLQRRLEQAFGDGVVVETADPRGPLAPLPPEEAELVAKAIPTRRAEFAAARGAARQGLRRLGRLQSPPIGRDPRGAPIWPEGVVGAITHCPGFCAAALAPTVTFASLGLDAEGAEDLPIDLLDHVCSPAERSAFPGPARGATSWGKVAFSAKEAIYKAYYPLAQAFLDFRDVELQLSSAGPSAAQGRFRVAAVSPQRARADLLIGRCGFWFFDAGRVFAGVSIASRSGWSP